MTKCHVRGEVGSAPSEARSALTQAQDLKTKYIKVVTGLWHSTDEKVTKCHVRGEVGSAPSGARSALTQAQDLKTKYIKVVTGLWRSGSAEDS